MDDALLLAALENQAPAPMLVLVGGPTAIGKTTVIDHLVATRPALYARAPSVTSRHKRPGESDSEYVFMDASSIRAMFERDELLNLDHVYGEYYGILRSSVEAVTRAGRSALKEVHPANHAAIRTRSSRCLSVVLLPSATQDHRQRLAALESGRIARFMEDQEFYDNIDLRSFDLIRRVSASESPIEVAEWLHTALQLLVRTFETYPRAMEIDRVNEDGYSRIASEFDDNKRITTAAFHELSKPFFSSVLDSWVRADTSCLEVGVGREWLRSTLAPRARAYFGVDIAAPMLAARLGTVDARTVATARALPFDSATIDVVLSSLGDPYCYPAALAEMLRVLRPGGLLALSVPTHTWSRSIRSPATPDKTRFVLSDGSHAEVFSFTFDASGLAGLLGATGFEVIESNTLHVADLPATFPPVPMFTAAMMATGLPGSHLPVLTTVLARRVHPRNADVAA